MTTKVKGLLKGLRYISQIFDEEEEKEIQIGFPTDVKHLAHIGCEDSSANAPSWMTEFKDTPEPSSGAANSTKMPEDNNNSKGDGTRNVIPRSRHNSIESNSSTNSPTRRSSEGSKHTRRHRSSDPSSESSRRHLHSNHGTESSQTTTSTKHSHRRKPKTVSDDGSSRRSSRTRRSSKGDSLSDISLLDLGSGPENGHGSKVES